MKRHRVSRRDVLPLIQRALREDHVGRDVTSCSLLSRSRTIRAQVVAKVPGVLAGAQVAAWTFQAVDPRVRCLQRRADGARLRRGQVIMTVEGRARSILAAERTSLNLLGHLCGVATLTQACVRRVRPHRPAILDTRKTLPGLRALEKYAVSMGGGRNHRSGLHDAVLIKTNHLRAMRSGTRGQGQSRGQLISRAVAQATRRNPKYCVEVEVTNISEFKAALAARPHAILLDNWDVRRIRKAVRLRGSRSRAPGPRPLLEVSGGVTRANIRRIASTGVERISLGRLTHSAPSLDLSLTVIA